MSEVEFFFVSVKSITKNEIFFPPFSRTNKTDSQTTASSKFTVPSDYNTADLRRELTQFGDSPGPITKSTKYLYMKRLMKFKRHPELVNSQSNAQKSSKYILLICCPVS